MHKNKLKIVFFGTPEFAAGILEPLIENKFDVAAVFTQPDKKVGRRQEIVHSPVKQAALKNNIKVFQPNNLRESKLAEEIRKVGADLFIVAAYGKILPKIMLEIPKFGAINIHTSLLPKYRGASPVQCAILSKERQTGITLMRMNEKMDEGDILAQEKIEIGEKETADVLLAKLAKLGAKMIENFIPDRIGGKMEAVPQDHSRASYCAPVKREDGKIDWNNSTAEEIFLKWRAYHPWPGIFSLLDSHNQPKRLKFLEIGLAPDADTGEKPGKTVKYNQDIAVQSKKGLIILKIIQLEGKREMRIDEFLRGYPGFVGTILK